MQIQLSATAAIFADDDKPTVRPNELPTISGHIVTRLNQLNPGRKVRTLKDGEAYNLDAVGFSSDNFRSRRLAKFFPGDLSRAVEALALQLDKEAKEAGPFALDLRFYDEKNNTDNKWGDFVDLFGRLVRVD